MHSDPFPPEGSSIVVQFITFYTLCDAKLLKVIEIKIDTRLL